MALELEEIVKKFNKTYPEQTIIVPGSSKNPIVRVDVIPSGSPSLDRALGIGGFPRGRVTEIAGAESSGKTTLALHAVAEAQKLGLWALYLDFEYTLDIDYAVNLGVDMTKMILVQADNGEDGFRVLSDILNDKDTSKDLGIIIVDSVAAIKTKHERDNEIGDSHIGQNARLLNSANRSLVPLLSQKNVALIYINQMRANIGMMYGPSEVTTGGKSIPYTASIRLKVSQGTKVDKAGETVAKLVRVDVIKNKLAPPYKRAELTITFGQGIDRGTEVVNELILRGIVKKKSSWFALASDGTSLGQGLSNVYENHKEILEALLEESNALLPAEIEKIDEFGEFYG
jgi:recombination protein RecA